MFFKNLVNIQRKLNAKITCFRLCIVLWMYVHSPTSSDTEDLKVVAVNSFIHMKMMQPSINIKIPGLCSMTDTRLGGTFRSWFIITYAEINKK